MKILFYEKPDALLQIRGGQHAVIEASAGTGKTYTIQHIVVDLLLRRKLSVQDILIVTFTRAATGDLKKKIRETLQELIEAYGELDDGAQGTLQGGTLSEGAPADPTNFGEVDEEGFKRLRRALRTFDQAAIYTIHGFCQRILVEHAFANKRLLEQEHVDGESLVNRAISEALREDVPDDAELRQWLQVYLGSGKKISDLRASLRTYVTTAGEYLPNFDRAQIEVERERLGQVFARTDLKTLGEAIGDAGVSTRTRNTIVDKHLPNFLAGWAEMEGRLAEALLEGVEGDFKKALEYLRKGNGCAALGVDPDLQQAMLDVYALTKSVPSTEILAVQALGPVVKERVEAIKQAEGVYTYDDMLTLVRDTLAEDGEDGALLNVLRGRFQVAIIDEFQDTDQVQWEVFERLFVGGRDGWAKTRGHVLYLIGDPKQAIYGFRGGDVHTYIEARDTILGGKREAVPLKQNFRSTPQVIGAYNAIFDQAVEGAIDLGEGIDYAHPVSAGKPWFEAKVGDRAAPGVRVLNLKTEADKIDVKRLRKGMAQAIAVEIRKLVDARGTDQALRYREQEGGELCGEVGEGSIYVLCHRRAHGMLVAKALREQGVPFAFLKMDGLFETPQARDIYDVLMALVDPHDRSARARAWMTPFFELSVAQLDNLGAITESDAIYSRLTHLARLGERRAYHELFQELIESSGLMRRRLLLDVSERELTNYQHLLEILAEECTRERLSIEELAGRLMSYIEGRAKPDGEDVDQQRLEVDAEAVQILTAHGSKGLQRGVVFMMPAFSSLINKQRNDYQLRVSGGDGPARHVRWMTSTSGMPEGWEEALYEQARAEGNRLNYVALTRAELMLYLPYLDESSPAYKESKGETCNRDPYFDVIDRLTAIRDAGGRSAELLEWTDVDLDADPDVPDAEVAKKAIAELKVEGLEHLQEPDGEERRLKDLLERRWEVTSFSKLRGDGKAGQGDEDDSPEAARGDGDSDAFVEGAQTFPGGMATGNFVHGVLEELEYARVRDYATEAEWVADEELREFFEVRRARFGASPRTLEPAMRAVYRTLLSGVEMPVEGVKPIEALHLLDPRQVKTELEFLFPIPEPVVDEAGEERLRRRFGDGVRVQGGFVTGFVDLLFGHENKIYFADWKSNLVSSYDEASLARNVAANYAEQAHLYTVALCRVLDIRTEDDYEARFGGLFYFYVRGMHPEHPGRGIYRARPAWREIVNFERSLFGRITRFKRGEDAVERVEPSGAAAE
ncbi:AAA family ATPase [Lujinxingia vulgaris]|uniref:DNA 3'-5' helicase n=1 Tax=Lujinxingia vulgaris TaxID=2600176 RepID=A0A5C6WYF1_9DELT|nr:UvrD-helicase domain-containing protein [Lujinxingia vulgaris]TXD32080.1 AAA family ATPase [Lujinxingia vulgaris]